MSVFVTDGDQRATLAVVRSLGAAGIPVTVGESHRDSLAASSRFCSRAVEYPSARSSPHEFQAFLVQEMQRHPYTMLLPMTDESMQLTAGVALELEGRVRLPLPAADRVRNVQDKAYVLEVAKKLGIGCPATVVLEKCSDAAAVASQIGFPVVIKPRFSRFLTAAGWQVGPVTYAHTVEELIAQSSHMDPSVPAPMAQEFVSGEGAGVFLLIWDGELKAAFCHRRLREKPPWGGVSVYRESLPLDWPMVERSYALLKELGWQGVAMVEYKLDGGAGEPRLMEINGRFWGSLQLAIDSGVNFPLILYRLCMGEDVRPDFVYQAGVKTRWLLGDLDQLWLSLRHPGKIPAGSRRTRWQAIAEFCSFPETDRNEVWRKEDPAPGWFECRKYLHDLLGQNGAAETGISAEEAEREAALAAHAGVSETSAGGPR